VTAGIGICVISNKTRGRWRVVVICTVHTVLEFLLVLFSR